MKHQLLSLCVMIFLSSGCTTISKSEPRWVDKRIDLQWPSPPDTPRIRYLRSYNGPQDFTKNSSVQKLFSWLTGAPNNNIPLVSPYGVAADGYGKIWIADMGIHGVHQIDLSTEEVSYILSAGSTPLMTPAGVAVDLKRNRLYISDTTLRKIFLYDLNGNYTEEWDTPDHFARPAGLAVDHLGQVYAVDAKKNCLYIFSPDGKLVRTIKSSLPPEESFNTPSNIAVNEQGQIFVVDSLNFRIEIFSPAGESLGTIGSIGDGPGYFARPRGIGIDTDGHIYVSDATFGNVQVFDKEGKLLIFFGQPGKEIGDFSLPAGLTIDQFNRIYIVDSYNQRLQIFSYLP